MRKMEGTKKVLSLLLALSLALSYLPVPALAAEDGSHHIHDDTCGYAEAVEGKPCTHQCTESCAMKDVTQCVHDHQTEGCGYTPAVEAVACDHVHDESCQYVPGEDGAEGTCGHVHGECAYREAAAESWGCGHVCTKETGCVKAVCAHAHDSECGFVQEVKGSECTHVCEECEAQPQADEAVEAVRAQIEDLPTPEAASAMTHDEKIALYNGAYMTAGNAYNALTEEQKAEVDAAKLMALAAYFADPGNLQTLETHTCNGIEWSGISSVSTPLSSGNYYLQQDITSSNNLTITGTVNLCLNGKKLIWNGTQQKITIPSGATLNIYDCGGNGTCSLAIENNGTLNIYGGTYGGQYINANGTTTYQEVINNAGTLHIYNATIGSDIHAIKNTGELTIDNCTIQIASTWTNVWCIDNAGGTAVINGGSFTSSSSHTIYSNTGSPSLTIKGGTFSNTDDNSYVLYVTHGTCTITDGIFNACSTTTIKGDNGTINIEGGSFASSKSKYIISGGTINISGGTFTTAEGGATVSASNGGVSGGIFKNGINLSNLEDKLAEGYAYYQNGEKVTLTTIRPGRKQNEITGGDVEVKKISSTYTVTTDSTTNGSVSASPTSAAEGDTVTLTVTPNEGYEIDTVSYLVEGDASPTAIIPVDGTYSFEMPAKNVTVTATFKEKVEAHTHSFSYIAKNRVITEKCEGCTHEATATITIPADADLYFTGNPITPAQVICSDGWQGGELTVNYSDNVYRGSAKASISKDNAKAETSFIIKYYTPAATLSYGNKNEAGWAQSATLTAPEGHLVSLTRDGAFSASASLLDANSNRTIDYFIKTSEDKTYKLFVSYEKVDSIAPGVKTTTVTNVTHNSATVTITAKNPQSGSITPSDIVNYTLYLEGTEYKTSTTGVFELTGLTANQAYTLGYSIMDAAGNVYNSTSENAIQFTTALVPAAVTTPPTVTLTYGETLAQAAITGGETTVDGTFAFKDKTIAPTVADSNKTEYTLVFTPTDAENYDPMETKVTVTVNPKPLTDEDITAELSDTVIFAGQPEVTVKDGDTTLKEEVDFTAAQTENNGEITLTITGMGNYSGDYGTLTYLVVTLPDPDKVTPDDKSAIDAYDRYSKLNETYNDAELTQKLEALQKALTAYKITKGNKSSYVKGSYKTLSFTANGYFGKFTGVKVDGKALTLDKDYTAEAGSTVITLKSSFLETLSAGKHTIQVLYSDGSTGGEDYFRVSINNGNPITGDNSHMLLFGGLAMTSLLCAAMLILFFPRKKGKYQR